LRNKKIKRGIGDNDEGSEIRDVETRAEGQRIR
jgi:hypothetical protein